MVHESTLEHFGISQENWEIIAEHHKLFIRATYFEKYKGRNPEKHKVNCKICGKEMWNSSLTTHQKKCK
jgi:hypothetical protein